LYDIYLRLWLMARPLEWDYQHYGTNACYPGRNAMKEMYSEGVTSTASILGHPLHPLMVAFPISFLVGTFVSDLAYWRFDDPFWARASLWLVAAGVVTGLLAAVLGLIDFITIRRARSSVGWLHFLGNLTAVGLSLVSWLIRAGNVEGATVPTGLTISLIVTLILVVTGWLGGELAFRHKIGVVGNGQTSAERR
jgi:uncharacterized membrane protein